ncbi:hypothetical protein [Rhizobacter sp. Root404]|uniref:hypothetical protein n=1 Tax=Rhizobacter sp. Root404 TaxID=1736528 RepID=UPI0006F74079|nr:hypothetical protein [Rhizobacter sp. Root404]KQW37679.1 hypothetical protein ASC76_06125 [Rhizobacter sp. Root404]
MNALGSVIFTVIAAPLLLGNRRIALLAMMASVLYLPQQQAIEIVSVNMTGIRLLELVALVRIVSRGELSAIAWNKLDSLFLCVYGYTLSVFLLRSDSGQLEVIGGAVDATLCYFTFRALLREQDEVEWFLRALVVIIVPFLILLSIESTTGVNPFSALGTWHSWVELRGDRPRVMGSFRNPSLLGTLGAAFMPLYIAQLVSGTAKKSAVLGLLACTYVVYVANSGGPLGAVAVGILGWLCWVMRQRMYLLRGLLLTTVCLLAVAMNAPVWSLIERVSSLSGGSGWHRAHLLTMAYRDIDLWWQAGMPVSQTRDWFPYVLGLTDTADITNTFLDFGLKAGLPAAVLFICLLSLAYSRLGQAIKASESLTSQRPARLMLWGLGCTLTVHVANWFSITYFDQIAVVWYFQLAAISTLSHRLLAVDASSTDARKVRNRIATQLPGTSRYPELR